MSEQDVERVARAICTAGGFNPEENCYGDRKGWCLWINEARAAIDAMPGWRPIDMILHCPVCFTQHIDAPDGEWENPTHRSHLCAYCKTVWRPADIPTNGVANIETKGKADTWMLPEPPKE